MWISAQIVSSMILLPSSVRQRFEVLRQWNVRGKPGSNDPNP